MQNLIVERPRKISTQPIFILGSARSGTSVLASALRKKAQIQGYSEGHFLPLIYNLMGEIDSFYEKRKVAIGRKYTLGNIPRDLVKQEILQSIKNLADSLFSESRWLDKTPSPEMIEIAPYLYQIWDGSSFIFAKRRGIECIISRLKKFPHLSFEKHCKIWARCMQAWLEVRGNLVDRAIEIDQREIALYPQETARNLGEFLNLEEQQIEQIGVFFSSERPQNTSSKESELAIDIEESGWTSAQIAIFRETCGIVNRTFGYSETSSYYLH